MISEDRYAAAADGWASGASLVYGPLAEALVAAAPHPLAGRRVLDLGAGTGLVGEALRTVGARPFALDASPAMLAHRAAARPPAVVGDVTSLPLRADAVDDVVAAFVLNHTADPVTALREVRRVTRSGGAVLATVYAADNHSAVRDRIDLVTQAHGFRPPPWYATLKAEQAPLLGDADAMARAARSAGLIVHDVVREAVDVGVTRPAQLVDYRLGQAHVAGWLAGLDGRRRARVRDEAVAAVAPVMEPYRPGVVRLVATAP